MKNTIKKIKNIQIKKFWQFFRVIKKNKIYITFNLEYYGSGEKEGKVHDRGTAFRLEKNCLS